MGHEPAEAVDGQSSDQAIGVGRAGAGHLALTGQVTLKTRQVGGRVYDEPRPEQAASANPASQSQTSFPNSHRCPSPPAGEHWLSLAREAYD